jgi:adenylyltransferase/sulfurtransferase
MSRYSRQELLSWIGKEGQDRLKNSRVVLVGCGALGSIIASHLVRAGVGFLRVCDRDFVELENLQRQTLFDERDVLDALPKAEVAVRKLRSINSEVTLEAIVKDINFTNVERLIEDTHLVMDGTDNFETRFLINDACVKHGIPWVYGACVGSYGMVMPIVPGLTPCFRCVISQPPAPGTTPTCDTAGILNALAGAVGSLQSAEGLKLLVGHPKACIQGLLTIDLWGNIFQIFNVERQPECIACVQGKFDSLGKRAATQIATLCGRDAVQIMPSSPAGLDLEEIKEKLHPLGPVTSNKFLLKFTYGAYEIVLFADGRAIIKGTSDPGKARALYAQYIGI